MFLSPHSAPQLVMVLYPTFIPRGPKPVVEFNVLGCYGLLLTFTTSHVSLFCRSINQAVGSFDFQLNEPLLCPQV